MAQPTAVAASGTGAGNGSGTVPRTVPAAGAEAERPVRARDLRLKGADAMIYLCAARLGLRPVVLRLVWDECNQARLLSVCVCGARRRYIV